MEFGVIIKDEDVEMRQPLTSAMSSDCLVSSEGGHMSPDPNREVNENGSRLNTPISVH